jgi:ribosomal-protein-alanine N-acetyltransferase
VNALIPERLDRGPVRYDRIARDDAADLSRLMLEPQVRKTLWPWPTPPSDADLRSMLDQKLDHWERHGFGQWLIRDSQTGEMVGRGGLQHCKIEGEAAVEIGWAVMPPRWGQGIATELALASIEQGFGALALTELVAFALPDNVASRRVMEKSGFTYARDIVHVGLPHVLYTAGPDHDGPAGATARLRAAP